MLRETRASFTRRDEHRICPKSTASAYLSIDANKRKKIHKGSRRGAQGQRLFDLLSISISMTIEQE
jgi:hypothetical protein